MISAAITSLTHERRRSQPARFKKSTCAQGASRHARRFTTDRRIFRVEGHQRYGQREATLRHCHVGRLLHMIRTVHSGAVLVNWQPISSVEARAFRSALKLYIRMKLSGRTGRPIRLSPQPLKSLEMDMDAVLDCISDWLVAAAGRMIKSRLNTPSRTGQSNRPLSQAHPL